MKIIKRLTAYIQHKIHNPTTTEHEMIFVRIKV
jgi:hypothetical protein